MLEEKNHLFSNLFKVWGLGFGRVYSTRTTAIVVMTQAVVYALVTGGICMYSCLNVWYAIFSVVFYLTMSWTNHVNGTKIKYLQLSIKIQDLPGFISRWWHFDIDIYIYITTKSLWYPLKAVPRIYCTGNLLKIARNECCYFDWNTSVDFVLWIYKTKYSARNMRTIIYISVEALGDHWWSIHGSWE